MMVITDEQFGKMEALLRQSHFTKIGLFHDLLDHFYCLTHQFMEEGLPFELAMERAKKELAPDGFEVIEQEVSLVITFNFYIRMNQVLYLGSFLAAFGQTAYVLFRTLHWPGAESFLLFGLFALFFMVIPILTFKLIKSSSQYSIARKVRILSGIVGVSLFGLGSCFKVFHWVGANLQIMIGAIILALVFFPLFFWQLYQTEKEKTINLA